MYTVSERWRRDYVGALVGALVVRNAPNVTANQELERRKRLLEADLRLRFRSADDIKAEKTIQAYVAYYRRFGKTYHLMQQLRTMVEKQRMLPVVSGLVDVMFMAEMKNLLLTAGHDLAKIAPPITLDVASGDEVYTKLNQESQVARKGDMMVSDRLGVLSSIIHGPDCRSRIMDVTSDVLYIVYAPFGVSEADVIHHAGDLLQGIQVFAPEAVAEPLWILSENGVDEVAL